MLYRLSELFPFAPWSVFKYVTFRSAGAAVTALFLSMLLGPRLIAWLGDLKYRQDYRPKDVKEGQTDPSAAAADTAKRGTPTMGGILIVLVLDLSVLLWAQWNPLVLLTALTTVVLAGLGFYDDWLKVTKQNAEGARSHVKLFTQFALAAGIAVYLWRLPSTNALIDEVQVPFLKAPLLVGLPVLGGLLAVITIVGSSNSVNLTDGMDGLAIGCTLICTLVFLVMTYIAGNAVFAKYLLVPHVTGASELTVVCAALIGACLGFLWFNCHPAEVFMGDTGSLALGGALGLMAVLIHQPFVLFIAGGVFVAEALSVMLQVGWFKITRRKYGTGRRIFLMSPLHHHFRKKGLAESKIVTRFYIVGILCAVVALSTLKVR
ncbi:MAG TPA: phospho-N-acetylmuramoyl-pentapeptide-transferase [Candidatus Limnocylindria bacterium]|nr:phospho-N-acetylmuramoyl-pentapeptide-transferase [Candidatus Limnocylindria bacterium]